VVDAAFASLPSPGTEPSHEGSPDTKAECSEGIQNARDLFTRIDEDGSQDRSALLAILELEKRARIHGASPGLGDLPVFFCHVIDLVDSARFSSAGATYAELLPADRR
jgi:hypothetical protein